MSRGAALTGALLVTLASPGTWFLALAAFLLRGGLLAVAIPIVVLPTPVGLSNLLAPILISVIFGGVSAGLVVLAAAVVVGGLTLVVAGGLVAAILEAEAARIVGADEEMAPPPEARGRRGGAGQILMARLLAHLPLGVALIWGSTRLVSATYRELTSPFDVATPIVWRVLRESPDVVVVVVLTWMLGQTLGAIAARRIAFGSGGTLRALGGAVSTFIRRPLTVLADFWLPTVALALVLAPSALAAASTLDLARAALATPGDAVEPFLAVVLFVALWIVGLVLTGLVCAWRAAVWTIGFGEPSR